MTGNAARFNQMLLRGSFGSNRSVDLALLAVAVTWGSSYLVAKDVVTPETVFAFLVLRFALACFGLALLLLPRILRITKTELALGALFGVILSIIFTLETYGVTKTSASNAGLIISLTIVMTPLLEQKVRRTHLPRTFYAATAVAVAGVGVLTQSGGFAVPNIGDLLILLAAVARAVHVTVIAHVSESRTLDSSRVTLVQLCTALVVFTILSQITGRGVIDVAAHLDARSWLLIAYLSIVCTIFAFFIQIWAVRRTSPARVSLLLGTEPLWAEVVGILVAGDHLTVPSVCGAALILAGTNWGRTVESRRSPLPATARDAELRGSRVETPASPVPEHPAPQVAQNVPP
jgi:drug/metabolite transporter (DMT)-like permease